MCPIVQLAKQDDDGPGRYEVVADGRGLVALQSLADDGALGPDHPVACHLLSGNTRATELSLVENTVRAAMHLAD